jgi:mRNA interferase MazF
VATSSRSAYCPERYDIVWLQFDPQQGREQAGRRPAFVLSPRKYNEIVRLCVVCPITSQVKGFPFEVVMPAGAITRGAVLSDQVKGLAWPERQSEFIETCPELAGPVLGRIKALIGS